MQPLVSFKLPKPGKESDAARRKVLKYFRYLLGDGSQPGIASGVKAKVSRRSKAKLEELQQSLGQGELPGVKYAFVHTVVDQETGSVVPVEVREDVGELPVISGPGYSYVKGEFDKAALFRNPRKEIARVMKELAPYAEGSEIARFRIANGSSRTYNALTAQEVAPQIERWMNKYTATFKGGGHYWADWLDGLIMDFAEDQRDFRDMQRNLVARKDARQKIKKLRVDYAGLLETLESAKRGRLMPEEMSARYSGTPKDKAALKLIEELADKGLTKEVSGMFMLTKQGRAYLDKFQKFHKIVHGS